MSERDNLLTSIADTIKTYRQGELPEPTTEHVDRWSHQFSAENQIPFLNEIDHVLKQTFLRKDTVTSFLNDLAENHELVGAEPSSYWAKANFLRIQKSGQSQKAMVSLFGQTLTQKFDLDNAKCGAEGGDYIYLDDVLFTGGRVASDLEDWITNKAPAKAVIQVILMAFHTSGHYYITNFRLKKIIAASGKSIQIKFWRLIELENQKHHRNDSDVLWPAVVPNNPVVQAYVAAENRFPLEVRQPGGALGIFSSEAGRQLLEYEFLIAGVSIRSKTKNPKDFIRPLGNGSFGVGFGSMISTYRNCPNNCPLAIWWGDPFSVSGPLHWYPLLSRKTYASAENIFNGFDDLTI